MTKCSQKLWAHKIGAQGAYSTKVESLPPTKAAFRQNVLRAHMQVCIWKSALMPNPPDLNPTDYGWVKDKENKSIVPVTLPTGISAAPENALKLVRCECAIEEPCNNNRCSCKKNNLPCTIFCNCRKEETMCGNNLNKSPPD